MSPEEIIAAARSWIGTPYRHQASLKGVGCDCLGLLRGVWREVMGAEPEAPPPYAAGWAESRGRRSSTPPGGISSR
jgi:NlpC/P60 family putative phage cell wall peptidase